MAKARATRCAASPTPQARTPPPSLTRPPLATRRAVQGHALLIPKAPGYVTIYDMPADVAANVLRELPRLAKAVQAATGCEGVNVVQNNGGAAGQVVPHAHFHVIPRVEGDGLVRLGAHGGGAKMIDPAEGNAVADAIRAAL